MQSHLDGLVCVAIVAVVDDVEGLNVGANHPVEHLLVALPHVVEVEGAVALDGLVAFHDLLAAHFVAAAVDGVEQGLGGVHAGAEELHLLADAHGGHAARDGGVVAPVGADLRIGLVLNRRGVDRNAGAELLVAAGQVLVPEDGDVRLGGRAEVHQSLEQTERGLGDQRAAVVAEAGVGPGGPVGVAREDLVVGDGAQEAGDAQLDHQGVDDLLRAGLIERAVLQVALEVAVEEAGEAADRHGGAVLRLHGGQVAEVGPLHSLVRVGGRAGDVVAVGGGQVLQLLQGLDLLGVLLAVARPVLGEGLVGVAILVLLLLGDEVINTVEGHAAVVTDDAATAVGIRQAGDDVGGAGGTNARGVDVEDRVVVGLAVLGEDLLHLGVVFLAGLVDGGLDHAPAAVGHHCALERSVGLETDDHVVVLADVTGLEGVDVGRGVGVNVEDAHLALFGEVLFLEGVPDPHGLFSGASQERGVALIRGVVQLDEVADVDLIAPVTLDKTFPGFLVCCRHSSSSRIFRFPVGTVVGSIAPSVRRIPALGSIVLRSMRTRQPVSPIDLCSVSQGCGSKVSRTSIIGRRSPLGKGGL